LNRKEFIKTLLAAGVITLLDLDSFGNIIPSAVNNKFIWGVAGAAYQVEGAAFTDGKGPSIWDKFSHKHGKIKNHDNGDIACDFYHLYKTDIDIVKSLNIPAFRFSLSWPRIIPAGTGSVNQKGLDFYKNVIEYCLKQNIEPWITLYHWDLPQALEDKGGWTNRDIVKWFEDYVDLCTRTYGDVVKNWFILNEPLSFTGVGYFLGMHAPGKYGANNFLPAAHHACLCNASGGRIAKANVKDGNIGTTLSFSYIEPRSDDPKDIIAAEKYDCLYNRLFIEPLVGMGYPVKSLPFLERIHKYIKPGDEDAVKFNFDFIGVQNYTREIIKYSWIMPYMHGKMIPANKRVPNPTVNNWEVYPEGIYKILKKVSAYPNIKTLYVTENGAAFKDNLVDGNIHDTERISFLKDYIAQVMKAKKEGVNVKGYFVWSLTDNFEWALGYEPRFGIVYVDYKTQNRTIKDSGLWYSKYIQAYNEE
jgi:beta-glucosidase